MLYVIWYILHICIYCIYNNIFHIILHYLINYLHIYICICPSTSLSLQRTNLVLNASHHPPSWSSAWGPYPTTAERGPEHAQQMPCCETYFGLRVWHDTLLYPEIRKDLVASVATSEFEAPMPPSVGVRRSHLGVGSIVPALSALPRGSSTLHHTWLFSLAPGQQAVGHQMRCDAPLCSSAFHAFPAGGTGTQDKAMSQQRVHSKQTTACLIWEQQAACCHPPAHVSNFVASPQLLGLNQPTNKGEEQE